MKIAITVPIPKTDQNQGHQHWRTAANARRADRDLAELKAKAAKSKTPYSTTFPWANASIVVRWFHKTKSFRDMWNMVGSLKGTIDGFVRAGLLVDDDLLQPPRIERYKDATNPRVEIELERIEE